ncbi:MAG: calcium/sodium antiporter, partial [Myxococcales bacterium]|nr:calcium/sodium antiporter [Myxococcales bacterium]
MSPVTLDVVMLLGGLVILAFAADRFVVSAARLSRVWGVSPVVVGALIVGMGTSAPELLVSVLAALEGDANLAIGNAVGSNVSNVTLVIGVTALVAPLTGSARVLRREGIAMLVAVVVLTVLVYDLELTRLEGLGLLAGMLVATAFILRWARQDAAIGVSSLEQDGPQDINKAKEAALGVLSLGATLAGAELLVRGGSSLAAAMGVGSAFIGMTVVAVGTSLPELATSIAGVRRHEDDLVVGNVLGSNLFNALAVAGAAAAINPGTVEARFRVGAVTMVVCAA